MSSESLVRWRTKRVVLSARGSDDCIVGDRALGE